MIRDFGGIRVWQAVISANRQHRVLPMQEMIGDATWYVPASRTAELAYEAAGAAHVYQAGGLCASRNLALKHAWAERLPCLQVSDDLKRVVSVTWPGAKIADLDWVTAVGEIAERLYESRFFLAGLAPTFNAYFADERDKTTAFIVGDLTMTLPCDTWYDERFQLKEDYDYTCQHYDLHGGALRVAGMMANFTHRTNPGGAVDVRTPELEQQMIHLLKEKWGTWIADNPKKSRPNEVLLRLPKSDRVVLS